MRAREPQPVIGVCTATIICDGPIEEAMSPATKKMLAEKGIKPPKDGQIIKGNLVVNTGREVLAKLLGNLSESFINRLILGQGQKSGNLPHLGDVSLVQELTQLDSTLNGQIVLNPMTDIFVPAKVGRFPTSPSLDWGSSSGSISIDGNGDTILEDLVEANFFDLAVQNTDQVTVNTGPNPIVLSVKRVIDAEHLELHNPNGYESPIAEVVQYRIDTPGTQLLISKLVEGNDYDVATWGAATIVHEAGLLFNTGELYNRVVFAPTSDDVGLILQPDGVGGSEMSVRFEFVITF
jgi:hypothetical protein